MPKAIKKKVVRTGREEDVKSVIHHVRESIEERKKTLLPIFIAFISVAAIVAGVLIYRHNISQKAAGLELNAYNIYYGLYQKQPVPQDERYRKALDVFKKAYDTKKSPFSLFYIANCYYNTGKYDEALSALTELNKEFPDDERFVPVSYYRMAVIYAKKGDYEKALKQLDTIYNYRIGSLKDLALLESARILASMGKKEDSAKKYEELSKNFPNSPFAGEAARKLSDKKG